VRGSRDDYSASSAREPIRRSRQQSGSSSFRSGNGGSGWRSGRAAVHDEEEDFGEEV
jgi:hypothetical protein